MNGLSGGKRSFFFVAWKCDSNNKSHSKISSTKSIFHTRSTKLKQITNRCEAHDFQTNCYCILLLFRSKRIVIDVIAIYIFTKDQNYSHLLWNGFSICFYCMFVEYFLNAILLSPHIYVVFSPQHVLLATVLSTWHFISRKKMKINTL